MADRKISELNNITGSSVADGDEFVVVDTSADETKAITASELRTAIGNGDFTVTGDLTVQGTTITVDSASAQNIVLGDNDKMTFGAGSDLQIYHDGAASYIVDNGTGNLRLQGVIQVADSPNSNDGRILFGDATNAQGTVHYDYSAGDFLFENTWANSAADFVFRTNSVDALTVSPTGIDVTGTVTADGLRTDTSNTNYSLLSRNSTSAAAYIQQAGSGNVLEIRSNDADPGQGNAVAVFNSNGDISFYEDTGTTAKFFWDASAESLGIGTSSPSNVLHVKGENQITLEDTSSGNIGQVYAANTATVISSDPSNSIANSNIIMQVDGSEAMRIDSSGNVGIGTSSPAYELHTHGTVGISDDDDSSRYRFIVDDDGTDARFRIRREKANGASSSSNDLTIVGGNVGIGTTSPNAALHVDVGSTSDNFSGVLIESTNTGISSSPDLTLYKNSSSPADNDVLGGLWFYGNNSNSEQTLYSGITSYSSDVTDATEDGELVFVNTRAGTLTEAMRIDSSGNVGIGTSSPAALLHLESAEPVIRIKDSDGAAYHQIFGNTSDLYIDADRGNNASSNIIFRNDATERMRIDSSGNVGIGISSVDATGYVGLETAKNIRMDMGSIGADPAIYFQHDNFSAPTNNYISVKRTSEAMAFIVSAAERMRIDSSGNLLVGQSSTAIPGAGNTTTGIGVSGQYDAIYASRSGGQPLVLNRNTSDGVIAEFRKDGAAVGSIGTNSNTTYIDGSAANTGLQFAGSTIAPRDAGALSDAGVDLGNSSYRFKDLYLSGKITNDGTGGIQIDTSGNVGIGTTSPNGIISTLETNSVTAVDVNEGAQFSRVNSSGNGQMNFVSLNVSGNGGTNNGWGGMGLVQPTASSNNADLLFFTRGSSIAERMRIDSSGNVGIGTTPHSNSKLHVLDTTSSTDDYTIHIEGYTPAVVWQDISGGPSTDFAVQVDNSAMMFRYGDASTETQLASEAMRIDSSGNLLVGTTNYLKAGARVRASSISATFEGEVTHGSGAGAVYWANRTSSDGWIAAWYRGGDSVGSISVTSSSTAYNTSSDYRLKTDAQPMTGASARVQALKPVNFEWISTGERVDGFLAHEAQEVVPEAVTGTKDAVDDDGNPVYQGIDQSKLVPLLTAALQEALTKIDALEARITTLEG